MTEAASLPASVEKGVAGSTASGSQAMVDCLHVHKAYEPGLTVFRDVTVRIDRGDFVCLTGPGGSGKTTFLSMLTGQEAPDAGTVLVDGSNVFTLGEKKLARFRQRIGVVFQDLKLVPHWTVFENVALPLIALSRAESIARQKVAQVLDTLRLLEKKTTVCEKLSASERQRTAVARALVHTPVLILADEPMAHLDEQDKALVWELLKNAHLAGATIILTAQSPSEAAVSVKGYSLEIFDRQLVRRGSAGLTC